MVWFWQDTVIKLAGLAIQWDNSKQKNLGRIIDALRVDIQNMVDRAVERIENHIDTRFDEAQLRIAQASINSCADLLSEWDNNQKEIFRVQSAIVASANALQLLDQLGWRQIEAYGDACSIRLLSLCVGVKTLGRGEIRNARSFVAFSLKHLEDLRDNGILYWNGMINQLTPAHCECWDTSVEWGPWFHCECSCMDGNKRLIATGAQSPEEDARAIALDILGRDALLAARQTALESFTRTTRDSINLRGEQWQKALAALP